MSEEEAIKMLKGIDVKFFLNGITEQNNYIVDKADEVNSAIDIILNLIERQENKIKQLDSMNNFQRKDIKEAVDYSFELNKKLDIAEKTIDKMSKLLEDLKLSTDYEGHEIMTKENWIEYFREKVKNNE